jgi:TPR repeat protein
MKPKMLCCFLLCALAARAQPIIEDGRLVPPKPLFPSRQQLAASAKAQADEEAARKAAQDAKYDAVWTTYFHQSPVDRLRRFEGTTLAAPGPGWAKFWGKVISKLPEGFLVLGNYSCGPRPPSIYVPWAVDDAFFARALAEGHYTNVALAFSGTFLLTNFPQERLLVGDSFEFQEGWWARLSGIVRLSSTNFDRLAGVARISSTNFHRLDYGEVVKLTDEEKAAASAAAAESRAEGSRALLAPALKFYQGLADQGDAYGQFRMGEFYRDGDALPKDLTKAKEFFAKAAAQGNPAAASALERLSAVKP